MYSFAGLRPLHCELRSNNGHFPLSGPTRWHLGYPIHTKPTQWPYGARCELPLPPCPPPTTHKTPRCVVMAISISGGRSGAVHGHFVRELYFTHGHNVRERIRQFFTTNLSIGSNSRSRDSQLVRRREVSPQKVRSSKLETLGTASLTPSVRGRSTVFRHAHPSQGKLRATLPRLNRHKRAHEL